MQLPPRPFQPPYAPMIVSSYPHSPPVMAPSHMPPPSLAMQPRAATPLQSTMSPPVGPVPVPLNMQAQSPADIPVPFTPSPVVSSPSASAPVIPAAPAPSEPFRAPLPWLSVPDRPFPARTPHRRRKGRNLQSSSVSVQLPSKEQQLVKQGEKLDEANRVEQTVQEQSEPQTPSLSAAPSVADSTQPTTPSSAVASTTARPQSHSKGSKPTVPVVPVLPVIPSPVAHRQPPKEDTSRAPGTPKSATASVISANETPKEDATEETAKAASPRAAPKSWADLVRAKGGSRVSGPAGAHSAESNGLVMHKSESLADVLTSLGEDVSQYSDKIAFLEPRGLINTGNMCYMNSVSWHAIWSAD
jgi:ubiquitin carboxyl-terminal hydrolase 10